MLRTARRGRFAGQQFWGCPGYPNCRGIVNIKNLEVEGINKTTRVDANTSNNTFDSSGDNIDHQKDHKTGRIVGAIILLIIGIPVTVAGVFFLFYQLSYGAHRLGSFLFIAIGFGMVGKAMELLHI